MLCARLIDSSLAKYRELLHDEGIRQFTMQVIVDGEGSQIRIINNEPREGDKEELEPLFRGAAQDVLRRLAVLFKGRT